MSIYKRYYLLDNVSETIIGNFFAKNDRMAEKVLDQFDFEKAHLDREDVSLFIDERQIFLYETYDEVVKSPFCIITDVGIQRTLELEDA